VIGELRVRDLGTIADVTIQLGPGLNVLTGETGAGKSLLLDALALLLGARADSALVRPGAGRTVVEGTAELRGAAARAVVEGLGLDAEDGHLVIRREVSAEGRSRAWVNGSPTTAAVLAELGAHLVDLHGQHETSSLRGAEAQRALLDAFAGADAEAAALREAVRGLGALRTEAEALAARRAEVERRADYLRHVVREIDDARLRPGEEAALEAEARRLGQAGTLGDLARRLGDAVEGAEDAALPALGRADRALTALERLDPAAGEWRPLLDGAFANLEELARVAAAYADGLEADPGRLDEVERRRDALGRLARKYGPTLDDVRATRDRAAAELELLDTAETDLRALGARRLAAEAAVRAAAAALTAKRTEAAARLERGVNRLLPELGLVGGRLAVRLEPRAEPAETGAEQPVFLVQLNAGLDAQPLAKVASGGELSRVMLALKVVLAREDAVPTLVFDEIDQGVGGEVGARVGEALAAVAGRHQVLVVTHLPQIAARADRHLVVAKGERQGIATSDLQLVQGEDRVLELARMLGSPDDPAARRLAQRMLRTEARRA